MSKLSKEEKLNVTKELAVAMAPYLWDRIWGFGLNLYFDDVHVDYREMHSFLFDEKSARDPDKVLGRFDEMCVEIGTAKGENFEAYRELSKDNEGLVFFIACEQEIFEEIYLYVWEGIPTAKGMVDAMEAVFKKHGLIFQIQGSAIEVFEDR